MRTSCDVELASNRDLSAYPLRSVAFPSISVIPGTCPILFRSTKRGLVLSFYCLIELAVEHS